jgi:hypothetical protein
MNQEENEQSKFVHHPIEMERQFHRQDYANGKLIIEFTDTGHLADSWNYAEKIGKGVEFERAVMRLIRTNLGRCLSKKEWTWKLGTEEQIVHPAREGRESIITISPDSFTAPSFFWQENNKGMVGGLIYHSYSGEWGIHT